MTRLLIACATLSLGVLAPHPPHGAGHRDAALPPAIAAPQPPAPTAVVAAADAEPLPETAAAGLPAAITADLAEFGESQGWGAPLSLRGWTAELNGDAHPDLLIEARYAATDAGPAPLYHFPYFGEGDATADAPGFRRGSALVLAGPIRTIQREPGEGRASLVLTLSPDAGATDTDAPITMRLRF